MQTLVDARVAGLGSGSMGAFDGLPKALRKLRGAVNDMLDAAN